MINGLQSGATALDIFSRQQELVSTNLAHLNTPGHRRMVFSFHEKTAGVDGTIDSQMGANVDRIQIDFSQGRLEPTDRQLDVAISGKGFFVYQGANENIYSRNGVLFRSPEGELLNGDGLPIMGEGGPIVIPPEVSDLDLAIDASGRITANGTEFGKLSIVTFDDNQLLSTESQTYFRANGAISSPAEEFSLVQGSRELSNAHPVTELISMIVSSRHFEAAQKVIRMISETIQEATRA